MLLSTPTTAHLLSSPSSPNQGRHHLRATTSSLHASTPFITRRPLHPIRFSPLSCGRRRCLVLVSSSAEATVEAPDNEDAALEEDEENDDEEYDEEEEEYDDDEEYDEEDEDEDENEIVVQGPWLVLKFIWMEKNIALGLDREIPGYGTVPLSPYYFWPRKDAWEELKTVLESKPWISQKKMIILLNQATDIINLWQQSGGGL